MPVNTKAASSACSEDLGLWDDGFGYHGLGEKGGFADVMIMHIPFRDSEMMKMTYCLGYWRLEVSPFNQEISGRMARLDCSTADWLANATKYGEDVEGRKHWQEVLRDQGILDTVG